MSNRIDALFAAAKAQGKRVFVPFFTAGDPDLSTTQAVVEAVARRMADLEVPTLFELGFPYSDPIADGPTIQASYTRALDGGVRLAGIFETVRSLRASLPPETPLVGMVSYTLVYRGGAESFLQRAAEAGLDGLIVPDLPVEEADELHELATASGLRAIQLIAPTTPTERATRIARSTSGFVYLVSVAGITGERTELPPELSGRVRALRGETDLPICIGFGISRPDQVAAVADAADGVIVGSAIVRRVAEITPGDVAAVGSVVDFVQQLVGPLANVEQGN